MTYEIPSQLQYEEKILFGLTFRQLMYAVPSILIAIAILKTNLQQYVKWTLAIIPLLIGLGFMFFNFQDRIIDFILFLRLRNIQGFDKIYDLLKTKIENNKINNNVAILIVEPINFTIKTKDEQDIIILGFKKFLNSIDFPIQIIMDSQPLKLTTYLKDTETRVNHNLKENFKHYKTHLMDTITSGKILNRNFYIAVKETTNLDIQIEVCKKQLEQLNLKIKRLENKELKEVISRFYESKDIYPKLIENSPNHIKINDKLFRVITATGYPRLVEAGFLDKIVTLEGDFDLSVHIEPYPLVTLMINLNKEIQKQRADLYSAQLNNLYNPSLEIQHKDTKRVLENIQNGSEKLFNVSLYINCRASSIEELNLLTKKVESELNSILITPRVPQLRMLQGMQSVVPKAEDKLNIKRNITSSALSAFFPFTSPFLQVDNTGIWFGLNKNNIPIIRDIFKLSNPNGCILASSGSGKSYLAKLLISRHLMNNTKVMIIDPQCEYINIITHFKGQIVNISKTSSTIINPLDLLGHEYAEKRLSLMDLMQVMLGEMTEPQKSFIDKALTLTYDRKGINSDPLTWENEPPIMEDLLASLVSLEKRASTMEKMSIRSLINRLSLYVDGVFSFLNRQTKINFNNDLVGFVIGDMPRQVQPVMMFLILDYVYMKMRSDIHRKLLVIDESWSLLERAEEASYIFEIVKTCRKFNMGLLMINQEVEGLLNSKAGKSVLANSSYTFLMRQKPAVMRDMKETFDLSDNETNFLLTAAVGEGILIMENDHTELKVVSSKQEHELITTNADERLKIEKQCTTKGDLSKNIKQCLTKESKSAENVKPKVNIEVDEFKGFYRHKDLSLPEVKYLFSRKYKLIEKKSIVSSKKEKFLIKPRFNESINHAFVIYDLKEFLEKKSLDVKTYMTKKPDITFEMNGKKYAIEVETGSILSVKKQLMEKIKLLKEHYDEWFFVVTDKNHAKKYKKYGKTIDIRYLASHLNKIARNSTTKMKRTNPVCRQENKAKNKK